MTVYDFEVKDDQENTVSLKDYEGKVLLIVNSALNVVSHHNIIS